jgi:flagellar protein FliO/FliZ
MMLKSWLYLLGVFLFSMQSVLAADEKIERVSRLPAPPVGAGQLANITIGLFLVLGLIFALAWLFRRYGNISTLNRSDIKILGGVSLGTKEKAILLEVEGEKILVGVTPNQVTRLHVLSFQQDEVLKADNIEDFAVRLQQEQGRASEVKT